MPISRARAEGYSPPYARRPARVYDQVNWGGKNSQVDFVYSADPSITYRAAEGGAALFGRQRALKHWDLDVSRFYALADSGPDARKSNAARAQLFGGRLRL